MPDEQKQSETTQTGTPQNETFHQRLKRLSQSDQGGEFFVKGSSLGPITFHRIGPVKNPPKQ